MLTLSQLKNDTADCELEYNGEQVQITYHPGKFTPAFVAEMTAWQKDANENDAQFLVKILADLMVDWDVRESPDTPVMPITVENLSQFPFSFLTAVFQALLSDAAMGKPSGMRSKKG